MSITPPDPDPVQKILNIFNKVADSIRRRQWSTLLVITGVVLLFLFRPRGGWVYEQVAEFFPKQYPVYFLILIATIFISAFLIKFFNLDEKMIKISRKWIIFLALLVSVSILFFLVSRTASLLAENNSSGMEEYIEGDRFSWGEEFLIPFDPKCKSAKDDGTAAYKNVDYSNAVTHYSRYVRECKNAAEVQIYLNNAKAMQTKKPFRIAVSIPISRDGGAFDSEEILRGVAIAQSEWNTQHGNKNLLVAIIDDGHGEGNGDCGINRDQGECQKAKEAADLLVKKNYILGVIGHFSSDATEAASKIYEDGKLVTISPTSTAVRKNSQCSQDAICLNSFIFRTAPDDFIAAMNLIEKIPPEIQKIAIVYEGESLYSRLFKSTFETQFKRLQSNESIVNMQSDLENPCNFSRSRGFNSEECLKEAISKDATALLLVPTSKNASNVNKILQENSRTSLPLALLGSDSMYKEQFIIDTNRELAEGMLVVVPWQRSEDPCEKNSERLECRAARIIDDSQAHVSSSPQNKLPLKISWRTATAYDATQALLEGLLQTSKQRCSYSIFGFNFLERDFSCLRREIKNILVNIEIKGALENGKVFDNQGDRRDNTGLSVVVEAREGEFKQKT